MHSKEAYKCAAAAWDPGRPGWAFQGVLGQNGEHPADGDQQPGRRKQGSRKEPPKLKESIKQKYGDEYWRSNAEEAQTAVKIEVHAWLAALLPKVGETAVKSEMRDEKRGDKEEKRAVREEQKRERATAAALLAQQKRESAAADRVDLARRKEEQKQNKHIEQEVLRTIEKLVSKLERAHSALTDADGQPFISHKPAPAGSSQRVQVWRVRGEPCTDWWGAAEVPNGTSSAQAVAAVKAARKELLSPAPPQQQQQQKPTFQWVSPDVRGRPWTKLCLNVR